MAPRGALLLVALLLLLVAVRRCPAQHWSHGWYPGGKRDLGAPPRPQVADAPRPCRTPGCAPRQPPGLRAMLAAAPHRPPWKKQ
ncbi:progonadoliberin-2 [Apteryx mantelli]|uniref:Progonadoliberin n=1 Tax=Apteryx mantelli TaxID=2696672 RepID=A0ABM4EP80_9AVES